MNEEGNAGGETLDLLVAILEATLIGTAVSVRIHLPSYSFPTKVDMLKKHIEEEGIASGAKAEALAEFYLNII